MAKNTFQEQVEEFHRAFGVPVRARPTLAPKKEARLRLRLIQEELRELRDAIKANDLVGIADALGDLTVVVTGSAICYGIDLQPVVDEIHRSNMSKLGEDGRPILREDGKVLKGPNYFKPDLKKVVEEQQGEPCPRCGTRPFCGEIEKCVCGRLDFKP